MHSVREALDRPWVLDIDASIKPLYGRQEGAEVGYNPAKPMRPSHVLHTFLVGNLRLVLDVQVSRASSTPAATPRRRLGGCSTNWATSARRWCGATPATATRASCWSWSSARQPYLLRLRQTKNVKRLVARLFGRTDWSRPDSQGCQMIEDQLQLHGWSTKRRVVIVRQRMRGGIARERRIDEQASNCSLDLAACSVHERRAGCGSTRCW